MADLSTLQKWEEEANAIMTKAAVFFQGILPFLETVLSIVGMFKKDPKAVAAQNITQASLAVASDVAKAYLASQDKTAPVAFADMVDMSKVVNLVNVLENHGSVIAQAAAPAHVEAPFDPMAEVK